MKCQICGEREATTHITKIVNGKKMELHLCSQCAQSSPEYNEMKLGMNFGISDFLTGMLSGGKKKTAIAEEAADVCPNCNMTYAEFLKRGKLGCGDCYTAFKNRLRRPIRQIHGKCEHIGKMPKRNADTMLLDKQIASLEAELNAAVLKQEFETAAQLRDKIKEIKEQGKKEA